MISQLSRLPLLLVPFVAVTAARGADVLPKDGTWARYYVHQKADEGVEINYRQTICFLRTVTEKGEKLRWVEFVNVGKHKTSEGKPITAIYTFLIPEKALRKSKNSLREFVRGWYSDRGVRRERFESTQLMRHNADQHFGPALAFVPGLLKTAKSTKNSKTVDHQDGQLRIKNGRRGLHAAVRRTTPPVVYTWKTNFEVWRHKSVALMAAAEFHTKLNSRRGKEKEKLRYSTSLSYTIEAWGKKGKSKLPPAK